MNSTNKLPEEHIDQATMDLIQCAYPHGIPDAHYSTLLAILIANMSIRTLSSVIANIRGGHYSTYMGEVGNAMRFVPDPRVKATVIEKLLECGYQTWLGKE
jgi:hypothetical protein